MESVDLTKNNVVGNFAYPEGFPAYRDVVKFLQNCFLTTTFTKTPSVIYHDYLREFWCSAVVENPDAPKEAKMKFSVKNGTKSLILDYKTFVKATGLDYTETFVAPPTEEEVKQLLLELGPYDKNHADVAPGALLNKAPIIKTWFPAPWRILMTFIIQVLGGNKSSTEQLNTTQSMIVYCLIEGKKIDLGEIFFTDLIDKLGGKSRQKHMSYPRFISCALNDLLGSEYIKPDSVGFEPDVLHKANYSRDPNEVTPVALTTYMLTAIQGDNIVSPIPSPTKKVKRKKGQGSRKVAQPKPLATETSAPKPDKRGQQQQTLTADTLKIISQSLAQKKGQRRALRHHNQCPRVNPFLKALLA